VKNTIIANSPSAKNCYGAITTDSGGNIVDDNSCGFTAASSRNSTDPKLDPNGLQNNGGPTQTIALLPDSPAIDAAVDCPPPTADQRGIARPQGPACDSGAFELVDHTPPQISPTVVGTVGANGWYVSDVNLTWSVVDDQSAITSRSGCDNQSVASDTTGVTFTCTATSAGGASSQSVTIKRDATAPTLSPAVNPNPIILGGSATVSAGAADALSGLATASCGTLDTSNVGTKSVSCTASDNAGNQASASASYQVIYSWSGFMQPVDNLPIVNSVKAGSGVPVKFSLGGSYGLNIFAAGYPKVQTVVCGSGAPIDEIEQTVTAGASSLSYDAASGQYSYTWKTDKSWAGSCRQLTIRLSDGTDHVAMFQFR
jgi:hypothetical protein